MLQSTLESNSSSSSSSSSATLNSPSESNSSSAIVASQSSMVGFIIKRLGLPSICFNFDLNDSLDEFRRHIQPDEKTCAYTLYNTQAHIYANDLRNQSLKEFFEFHYPALLNQNEITFYFTYNLEAGPLRRMRRGELIIPSYKRKRLEERSNHELICPITQELITDAIKINGHFYDIHAMSRYICEKYNQHCYGKAKLSNEDFQMLVCPLQIPLSKELINIIMLKQNGELSTEYSMLLYLCRYTEQGKAQAEYNALLEEYSNHLENEKKESDSKRKKFDI